MGMEYEYDPNKSNANKIKHGIDFEQAITLWLDPNLIEIPARTADEPRFMLIGMIQEKYWTAIVTYRKGKVRIISVRRARREEIEIYES